MLVKQDWQIKTFYFIQCFAKQGNQNMKYITNSIKINYRQLNLTEGENPPKQIWESMKSMKEIHTADCCHIQLWPHLIMVRSKGPGAITTDLCGLFMKQICSLSGPHLPHLIAIAEQHSILCELHVILKDEPWENCQTCSALFS